MQFQTSVQQEISVSFRIKSQSNKATTQLVGHYKIGQMIGRGGFAKVYKATELYTKTEVAVKIIKLDELSVKDVQHLKKQIQIHKHLQHPNIIRIYEVLWMETKVYLFMELAKGRELFDYVRNKGRLPEEHAAKIFYQIVLAVKYLHDNGIAHRDIKTENIMIDENYNAKLLDFGLAKTFDIEDPTFFQTFCGSPSYTAPELIQKRKYSGEKVDIWCLGVTLYVLLQANLPFDDFDKKLRQRNIQFLNWHVPLYSSQQAIEIYYSIFTKQKKRISIENLLKLRFFKKYYLINRFPFQIDHKQVNSIVIKKVSKILDISQKQVEKDVQNNTLGEVYCVYQLSLLKKQGIQEEYRNQAVKSEPKRPQKPRRQNNISTMSPMPLKIKFKSRPASPKQSLFRVLPMIDEKLNKRRHSKQLSRLQNDYSVYRFKTDPTEQVSFSDCGFKFKNIFTKNIDVSIQNPKLKEESPQRSMRILKGLRRYT